MRIMAAHVQIAAGIDREIPEGSKLAGGEIDGQTLGHRA